MHLSDKNITTDPKDLQIKSINRRLSNQRKELARLNKQIVWYNRGSTHAHSYNAMAAASREDQLKRETLKKTKESNKEAVAGTIAVTFVTALVAGLALADGAFIAGVLILFGSILAAAIAYDYYDRL